MNIGEIVKDSLRYPFSDWKKILVLGIILVIGNVFSIATSLGITNIAIISLLFIIGSIIGFLSRGYRFRIIKLSLTGVTELPKFNAWINMFIDGIKVFVVGIVYLIPVLIIGIFAVFFFGSALLSMISHQSTVNVAIFLDIGILALIVILYAIIILPIVLIAQANMADNDSKLGAAFRIGEIFNKIGNIGWGNFIMWYILNGILVLILVIIAGIIISIISKLTHPAVGQVLISLIVVSYIEIYIYRSVALIYMSEKNS